MPLAVLLMLVALAAGCERRTPAASGGAVAETGIRIGTLWPGPPGAAQSRAGEGPFDRNPQAIAAGERLYNWYNCSGCHFSGGGGIGPPLMDDEWIYGGETRHIVHSIIEGRPQGMPSYGGRIPDEQVWQIAAYVRSLSRTAPEREERSTHSSSGADPGEEPPGGQDDAAAERREEQAGGGTEEEP